MWLNASERHVIPAQLDAQLQFRTDLQNVVKLWSKQVRHFLHSEMFCIIHKIITL
jgi:hypothetical protein